MRKSNLQKNECGIPLGFLPGPLLFTMYIIDLPSVSAFSATLYEDDKFLALSDKNFINLDKKVFIQLKFIDERLRQNKL